jgi:hypothetical protein
MKIYIITHFLDKINYFFIFLFIIFLSKKLFYNHILFNLITQKRIYLLRSSINF